LGWLVAPVIAARIRRNTGKCLLYMLEYWELSSASHLTWIRQTACCLLLNCTKKYRTELTHKLVVLETSMRDLNFYQTVNVVNHSPYPCLLMCIQ
jgi:hypothetical protein